MSWQEDLVDSTDQSSSLLGKTTLLNSRNEWKRYTIPETGGALEPQIY